METQENIILNLEAMLNDAIEKKAREIISKEFPFAKRGFISLKEAAEFFNTSVEVIKQMIDDTDCPIKALKKGNSEHNSIFFSSCVEYLEFLKVTDFQYDKYFRNAQGAKRRGKIGNIALCERLGIKPNSRLGC